MLRIDESLSRAWLGSIDIEPESKRAYLYAIRIYGSYLDRSGLSLDCTTAADVRRFSSRMSRKHAPSVAVSIVNAVKRFYRWAEREGLCRDVAEGVPVDDRLRLYSRKDISVEEARRILRCTEDPRDRAVLSLIIRCALKPHDLISVKVGDVLLLEGSGEIRLPDGSYMPLTRACAAELSEYMSEEGFTENAEALLFFARTRKSRGVCLSARRARELVRSAFQAAGMPHSAGEYFAGSASVGLAIMEGEPSEVIVSLCDRTYPYRKR